MTYRGTYPVLKPLEIVTALEGWGISISKEQLARPTPEFVETIFCACLRRVTNISDESLAAPMDEILEHAPIFEERVCILLEHVDNADMHSSRRNGTWLPLLPVC